MNYREIIQLYLEGENKRKEWAKEVALSDHPLAQIASDLNISYSKVNDYRNAYVYYRNMLTAIESPRVMYLWEKLYISHWIAISKQKDKDKEPLSFEVAFKHLDVAEGEKIETFRMRLSEAEGKSPVLIKLKRIWTTSKKILDDYMSEFSPKNQEKLRNAFDRLARDIQEVADSHAEELEDGW